MQVPKLGLVPTVAAGVVSGVLLVLAYNYLIFSEKGWGGRNGGEVEWSKLQPFDADLSLYRYSWTNPQQSRMLFVGIASGWSPHYTRRRQEWRASTCPSVLSEYNVSYRFFIGEPIDPDHDLLDRDQGGIAPLYERNFSTELLDESTLFGDIEHLPMRDVYKDLTYKVLAILNFGLRYTNASFIAVAKDGVCLKLAVIFRGFSAAAERSAFVYGGHERALAAAHVNRTNSSTALFFKGDFIVVSRALAQVLVDKDRTHSFLFAPYGNLQYDQNYGRWVKHAVDMHSLKVTLADFSNCDVASAIYPHRPPPPSSTTKDAVILSYEEGSNRVVTAPIPGLTPEQTHRLRKAEKKASKRMDFGHVKELHCSYMEVLPWQCFGAEYRPYSDAHQCADVCCKTPDCDFWQWHDEHGCWFGRGERTPNCFGGSEDWIGAMVSLFKPAQVDLTMYRENVGQAIEVKLSASDTDAALQEKVYGDLIYSDDTPVAAAALHSGVLKPGQAGVVRVTIRGQRSEFEGATRNGITSFKYGEWYGSYSVEASESEVLDDSSASPEIDSHAELGFVRGFVLNHPNMILSLVWLVFGATVATLAILLDRMGYCPDCAGLERKPPRTLRAVD
eukprot:g3837.t1